MVQLVIDDLAIEVMKPKIKPTLMIPKLLPFAKLTEGKLEQLAKVRVYFDQTGNELGRGHGVTYKDQYVLGDRTVSPDEIIWLKEDGSESALFEASKIISPRMIVPRTELQNYQMYGFYELPLKKSAYKHVEFNSMLAKAYEKAEQFIAEGKVGMGTFVFRKGQKAWISFIYPVIKEVTVEEPLGTTAKRFQFCWILAVSNTRIVYQHLQDVPTAKPMNIPIEPELNVEAFIRG